ncbi:MAG: DUF5663 domain-containing protein [Candidatus Moranbacteria bacterium]|nr:DUF5663 domain-containing protein [Candidatus Moranbacteria bacterium]MDD3965151.1 DUF5663 domain-containing protein [Candidatus Moranbacteria bacterium]
MALDQEALKTELIEAFHLENVPEDKKEELLAKIGEALVKRIFIETMEKLGDENVAEYESLLNREAKQEELESFFENKIPGYNIFVRGVVDKFKEELTEGAV